MSTINGGVHVSGLAKVQVGDNNIQINDPVIQQAFRAVSGNPSAARDIVDVRKPASLRARILSKIGGIPFDTAAAIIGGVTVEVLKQQLGLGPTR